MVQPLLRLLAILTFTCHVAPAWAQYGKLNIYAEPGIDAKRSSIRLPSDTLVDGYRLQLVSSENLGEVRRAREKFKMMYPDVQAYLKYEAPNLKLRAGNFRNPLEAQYLFFKLKDEFPYLFIVPDKVEARFLE